MNGDADAAADEATSAGGGILAKLRANPALAAVEVGSLAVAVGLPVATLWALVSPGDPPTDVLVGVVLVGAAFAALWTLAYPVYDAVR